MRISLAAPRRLARATAGLAAVLAFAPSAIAAQFTLAPAPSYFAQGAGRLRCNDEPGMHSYPAAKWFAGNYSLTAAYAQDGASPNVLEGLNAISIPNAVGSPGKYKWYDDHGNYFIQEGIIGGSRTKRFGLGFARPNLPGPDWGMSGDKKNIQNAGYCVNVDKGHFFFRGGAQRDWRWKYHLKISWDGITTERYVGEPVFPTLLFGIGFPVQSYRVKNWEHAVALANDFFVNRNDMSAPRFTIFELVLQGVLWKENYTLTYRCGSHGAKTCTRQTFRYNRRLVGELRKRDFLDPRIGHIDHMPAGVEYRMTVVFTGTPIASEDQREMDRIAREVKDFCGTDAGCGWRGDIPPAEGTIEWRSEDADEMLAAACQHANGGRPCETAETLITGYDATQAQFDSLEMRGDTDPTLTTAQRVTTYAGNRGDPNNAAPSQFERYCRAKAQQDSIDKVDGPRPVGQPRPTVTSVEAFYQACLRSR